MISFLVALPHRLIDEFINSLKLYLGDTPRFVIGMETATDSHADTQGEHMHVIADMDEPSYDRFRKTILVKKYKLRGQARNGHPRQYGKVRCIRDETRMLRYTCKDQNVKFEGYTIEEIQDYIKHSFPKRERRNLRDEVMSYLDKEPLWGDSHLSFNITLAEKAVIRFYMEHTDKTVTRNIVKNHVVHYLQLKKLVDLLYNYIL